MYYSLRPKYSDFETAWAYAKDVIKHLEVIKPPDTFSAIEIWPADHPEVPLNYSVGSLPSDLLPGPRKNLLYKAWKIAKGKTKTGNPEPALGWRIWDTAKRKYGVGVWFQPSDLGMMESNSGLNDALKRLTRRGHCRMKKRHKNNWYCITDIEPMQCKACSPLGVTVNRAMEIKDWLATQPKEVYYSKREISTRTGAPFQTVQDVVTRMARRGELEQSPDKIYCAIKNRTVDGYRLPLS